jgi:hypothetical protein
MRRGLAIFLGVLMAGCASKPAPPSAAVAPIDTYDDAVAAALVYDPPVLLNSPRLEVSREGRGQAAFAGFDEVIATYYYLRIDDRQQSYGNWRNDRFERQAITTRVGVSYR